MKDTTKNIISILATPVCMALGVWWLAKTVTIVFLLAGIFGYAILLWLLNNPHKIVKASFEAADRSYPSSIMLWFSRIVGMGVVAGYYYHGDYTFAGFAMFSWIFSFFIMNAIDRIRELRTN